MSGSHESSGDAAARLGFLSAMESGTALCLLTSAPQVSPVACLLALLGDDPRIGDLARGEIPMPNVVQAAELATSPDASAEIWVRSLPATRLFEPGWHHTRRARETAVPQPTVTATPKGPLSRPHGLYLQECRTPRRSARLALRAAPHGMPRVAADRPLPLRGVVISHVAN
jgi:hypothetical protein